MGISRLVPPSQPRQPAQLSSVTPNGLAAGNESSGREGAGRNIGPRPFPDRARSHSQIFFLPRFFVKAVKAHAKAAYLYTPEALGLAAEFQIFDVLKLKLKIR